jgi:hypothetical protein
MDVNSTMYVGNRNAKITALCKHSHGIAQTFGESWRKGSIDHNKIT